MSFADVDMFQAMQNLLYVNPIFLDIWQLLGNTLHIYILLYKIIVVELLEYQLSGQNSIFTLSIFIKFSYNYSFVEKKK